MEKNRAKKSVSTLRYQKYTFLAFMETAKHSIQDVTLVLINNSRR